MRHGKWTIEKNVKPIPDRRFDFDFYHEDFDGTNGLAGAAESEDDALRQIAEIEEGIAGVCTECGNPVYHRGGKPGEFDHECK